MVQERQVLADVGPAQATGHAEGVEVDHGQAERVVRFDPDQEVAGMEVLVDEAGVVEPGGQVGEDPARSRRSFPWRFGGIRGSCRSTNSSSGKVLEISLVTR